MRAGRSGVQVILGGPLEKDLRDEKGFVANASYGGRLFREVSTCWDDVGYFTVHRYHVRSPRDVVFKPLGPKRARGRSKRARAGVRIRDSDIILRSKPFLAIVKKALANLERGAAWTQVE